MRKKKIGLVLGRFQPLHPGHISLIIRAIRENHKVVICIGSSQLADPLTAEEREKRIRKQLDVLGYSRNLYRIVRLTDPHDMSIWPACVKEACGITDETANTFYRADKLECEYKTGLRLIGFRVKIVKRQPFFYKAPDGFYRLISSATEIRELHRKFRCPV